MAVGGKRGEPDGVRVSRAGGEEHLAVLEQLHRPAILPEAGEPHPVLSIDGAPHDDVAGAVYLAWLAHGREEEGTPGCAAVEDRTLDLGEWFQISPRAPDPVEGVPLAGRIRTEV